MANTAVIWPVRFRQIHAFFRNRSPGQMLPPPHPGPAPGCHPVSGRIFWNAIRIRASAAAGRFHPTGGQSRNCRTTSGCAPSAFSIREAPLECDSSRAERGRDAENRLSRYRHDQALIALRFSQQGRVGQTERSGTSRQTRGHTRRSPGRRGAPGRRSLAEEHPLPGRGSAWSPIVSCSTCPGS